LGTRNERTVYGHITLPTSQFLKDSVFVPANALIF
jgi:hypothetical protein